MFKVKTLCWNDHEQKNEWQTLTVKNNLRDADAFLTGYLRDAPHGERFAIFKNGTLIEEVWS